MYRVIIYLTSRRLFEQNWQATSLDEVENTNAGLAVRDEEHEDEKYLREEKERLAELEKEREEIHEKNQKLFAQAMMRQKNA